MPTSAPSISAETAVLDASHCVAGLPPAVAAVCSAWLGFTVAVDAYQKRVGELRATECEERSLDPEGDSYKLVLNPYETDIETKKVRDKARRLVVSLAEKAFGPRGSRLEIGGDSYAECPASEDDSFDPVQFWHFLAGKFSGGAGARKAYASAGCAMASALDIKRGLEPKTVGGRIVLVCEVYPGSGSSSLGNSSIETLRKVFRGIAAIGEWADAWTANEPADLHNAFALIDEAGRYKGEAPGRFMIGDAVLVVPFKSKYELRLSPQFAETMQLFLTEFDAFSSHM